VRFLLVAVRLCLTSMLAVTMRSAPPSSGQESLKCGRRNSRGERRHAPLRDLNGHLGRATVPAAAHVGFSP
jgi:hypothetical protein